MARLIIEQNKVVLKDHPLRKASITLGRQVDNNIVLDNPEVSSHHARIDKKGSLFILTDIQSTNGTYVNDKHITSQHLSHGDRIRIGGFSLLFVGTEKLEAEAEEKRKAMDRTIILGVSPKMRNNFPEARRETGKKEAPFLSNRSSTPSRRLTPAIFVFILLAVSGWFFSIHNPSLVKRIVPSGILGEPVDETKTPTKFSPGTQADGSEDAVVTKKIWGRPKPISEIESPGSSLRDREVLISTPTADWEPSAAQDGIRSETAESTFAEEVDSSIELEGIVWSSDVRHSFAVINGFTIRVGETIEGMTVTNIGRNHVTLQAPGEDSEMILFLR